LQRQVVEFTSLIFVLIGVPVVFCVLTYLVATAYRIYVPEKLTPIDEPVELLSRREARTERVLVGIREIKEDQRRLSTIRATSSYTFSNGLSSGLPSDWIEEVRRRRN
jgi:hypothetical protein